MTAPHLPSDAADGPITGDDYNYAAFSLALKPTGLENWLTEGPKPGETAPDFRLEAVDGTSVRLHELRGRPVVLEFGSYTCPVFCSHIEPMEAIARRHPEAAFFVLYTREAHPGEAVPRHRAMADKRQAARRLLADEPIRRTVLIDDVAGTVHRAYGQAWDSVYVIDPGGTIVLRQAWTNPADVEAVLAGLAAGTRILPRQTTQMAPLAGRPLGESLLRGGKQALVDFYTTAPPPLRQQIRQSPSAAVQSALLELTRNDPADELQAPGTIRLAYDLQGSGPPLVFIHGLTFDRTNWQPITARLASGYRCIAIDLPGHGGSDGPPRPLDDIAAALHRLLDELGIEPPVVVGHSMGAALAGIYAATYPVRGVVDVDQPLYVRPFAELVHALAPALRGGDFDTAFEPFRQSLGLDRLPEPERSRITGRQRIRQDLVVGYWDEVLATAADQLQGRIDDAFTAIKAPLLAVFGHALDDQEREHLRRLLPSAEVDEWPGHGHLVHLEEPDRFARRLSAFASQCFPPG